MLRSRQRSRHQGQCLGLLRCRRWGWEHPWDWRGSWDFSRARCWRWVSGRVWSWCSESSRARCRNGAYRCCCRLRRRGSGLRRWSRLGPKRSTRSSQACDPKQWTFAQARGRSSQHGDRVKRKPRQVLLNKGLKSQPSRQPCMLCMALKVWEYAGMPASSPYLARLAWKAPLETDCCSAWETAETWLAGAWMSRDSCTPLLLVASSLRAGESRLGKARLSTVSSESRRPVTGVGGGWLCTAAAGAIPPRFCKHKGVRSLLLRHPAFQFAREVNTQRGYGCGYFSWAIYLSEGAKRQDGRELWRRAHAWTLAMETATPVKLANVASSAASTACSCAAVSGAE